MWSWDRRKLRSTWLQQGAYLLRTNLTKEDPLKPWAHYIHLTDVESVFRTLNSELNLAADLAPDSTTNAKLAFRLYSCKISSRFDTRFRVNLCSSWFELPEKAFLISNQLSCLA